MLYKIYPRGICCGIFHLQKNKQKKWVENLISGASYYQSGDSSVANESPTGEENDNTFCKSDMFQFCRQKKKNIFRMRGFFWKGGNKHSPLPRKKFLSIIFLHISKKLLLSLRNVLLFQKLYAFMPPMKVILLFIHYWRLFNRFSPPSPHI